jgi:hypothetical protein
MTALADDDLLKEEYFRLHKTVEVFDQRALTIKAWSVTLSMAGIGAAFTQKTPMLLLLAAASSLLFWITEAIWKSFQQAFYERILEIESYYVNSVSPVIHLQITKSWSKAWHRDRVRTLWRIMYWPHVQLPHSVIVVGGPLLWGYYYYYSVVP